MAEGRENNIEQTSRLIFKWIQKIRQDTTEPKKKTKKNNNFS